MSFVAWMDVRHEGIEATPRELADRGDWGLGLLLDRMRCIGNLVIPDKAIVEGGLLGFPAEEHLAARKADAERRRIEAEDRLIDFSKAGFVCMLRAPARVTHRSTPALFRPST
jgi:hypothetical protein